MALSGNKQAVTIVIPCFNEAAGIEQLAHKLDGLRRALHADYHAHFLFVDDASTDETLARLRSNFAGWQDARVLCHSRNQGVAAAIRSGIDAADSEVVCSIDADCTYDPMELAAMIPLLGDKVDLVTASPYHPLGRVRNLPVWRLLLSRTASGLYRQVLRHQLFTYTSCFRVYRKSTVTRLAEYDGGYRGIVELLAKIDLSGGRILEHPATLDVRKFGQSKLRLLQVIGGHLALLGRLAFGRRYARLTPAPGLS